MITLKKILEDKQVVLLEQEHNFSLLPDLEKALQLFDKHIQSNNPIGILGDFDTDGITSTSSFILGLRELFPNMSFFYRVPERTEGHGINDLSLEYMKSKGVKLIITCDNGSNDIDMIHKSQSMGIDVIVTDHHQVEHKIEDIIDYCLINPESKNNTYPFQHLCGVGIVYKFLQAIQHKYNKKLSEKTLNTIQQLVCIGTVVDMVRLQDENLYFVSNFRKLFEKDTCNFFRVLKELTQFSKDQGKWFGWTIGPLFNGAGRLEKANLLISLICDQDKIQNLGEMIQYYINLNLYRKELTKEWSKSLKNQIIETEHVVLINYPGIPPGLKRLLANEYLNGKIAFCGSISPEDSTMVECSVSNAYGVNVLDFLASKEYTTNVGGHYGAFGYSYKLESQQQFLDDLTEYVKGLDISTDDIEFDYELSTEDINISLCDDITSFVWGTGLSEPKFKITGTIVEAKILAEKHTKYTVKLSDNRKCFMLCWNNLPDPKIQESKEFIVSLETNVWNNNKSIQFTLVK